MKISGLQPVTASDFPGRLAAIVFTQGCNFRCPFCHNGKLIATGSEDIIDLDAIFTFLQKREKLLDGLVISGGEPCLQRGLARFCYHVKKMGYAIKLDTNGSRPEVVRELLAEKLVDFIAMDIKAPMHRMKDLTGTHLYQPQIRESISLIAASGVEHLFRTTDVTPLLSSKDHEHIKDLVPQGSCHVVQPFVAANAMSASLRTTM